MSDDLVCVCARVVHYVKVAWRICSSADYRVAFGEWKHSGR